MEKLITIGTFSSRTGLSVSALRFYASQELLVPAEVDSSSGYRRYAESQVSDGILIRDLRRLDMPLRDIAVALQRTDSARNELVETHLSRLEEVVSRAHTLARNMGIPNEKRKHTTMNATLEAGDLAEALDQILPATATDPELPHLMGVLIDGKDGSIRLAATDRHRLAIRDLVPSRLDSDFSAIVPAATLAKWRSSLTGNDELIVTLDASQLKVTGPEVELAAAVMPVTFPDYERLLRPAENATSAQIDRQQFVDALQRFEEGSTVEISTSEDSLEVRQGQQAATLAARCRGERKSVLINTRFARDATRNALGREVVVEIEDPLRPVLFRSADDGTFTSRVMPITPE